jgi:hypothetical protein
MKFPGVRLISTVLPGFADVALAGTGGRTVSCELGMIPQPKLQRTKSGIWRWRIAIIWQNFTINLRDLLSGYGAISQKLSHLNLSKKTRRIGDLAVQAIDLITLVSLITQGKGAD